jgi:peptidoglycan/LPS O-acetylase OafA/YrhL
LPDSQQRTFPPRASSEHFRFDIQFLRGIAVLLVTVFHAFRDWIPFGFLGVDVFFVISGFLITGHVLRDLDRGSFSFPRFLLRRAKRLLPATYATLILTTALAYWLLTSVQWGQYLNQLLATVTFSANFVMAQQANYFAEVAETKPLLHIWSLSLEEQFYFVMPLALWAAAARYRLPLLAAGGALSLALCIWAASTPEFRNLAFYLLPTRAWELLAGSLCAWAMLRRPSLVVPPTIKWLALGTLLAVCALAFDPVHPRGAALVAVAATALMILGRDGWVPRHLLTRPIAKIGDWSYSLYLLHWPLLSFAYIAYLQQPPAPVLLGLLALSIALAGLQYRFVEEKFRHHWVTSARAGFTRLAAATMLLLLLCLPAILSTSDRYGDEIKANIGLAPSCNQESGALRDLPECRNSARPTLAVWGDSYAMQLVPGLTERTGLIQFTRSACRPMLSGSAETGCLAFNQSVFEEILRSPDIRRVILSGNVNQQEAEEVARTARQLMQAGKMVSIVGPTPSPGFDAGGCAIRKFEGKPTPGRQSCVFQPSPELGSIRRIFQESGARVAMPQDVLCRPECSPSVGERLLYHNKGHLTPYGSRWLMARLWPAMRWE